MRGFSQGRTHRLALRILVSSALGPVKSPSPTQKGKTMSKVMFKYPLDVGAECRITGFKGTIIARREYINGSVQYALQPKITKKDDNYVSDAKTVDEGYILGPKDVNEEVKFKFKCGDKVKNIINDFEGVVTKRQQWLNGCIEYTIEGKIIKSDLHGLIAKENNYWEQELEIVKNKKAVKVKGKKRSGGPSETFCSMETI